MIFTSLLPLGLRSGGEARCSREKDGPNCPIGVAP